MVFGYLEQPEEDVPPEEIWHHSARLEEWFAAVKQRREDPGGGGERIEDAAMTRNELADEVLGGGSG